MMSEIDLLLVNPNHRMPNPFSGIEPPLWCGLLATFTRNHGYSVSIIDAEAEDLTVEETAQRIVELNPSLVAIVVQGANPSASSTPKMEVTRQLLDNLNYTVKTILIGIHPSALPIKTLQEERTDCVANGEGFYTILSLLEQLKKGWDLVPVASFGITNWGQRWQTSPAPLITDLPEVAWDLLPMEKYKAHNWHCLDGSPRQPYGVIYTSLGCPFHCSYCNIHALYNNQLSLRYRKPEAVVQEIDILVNKYKIRNIKIADEMFGLNQSRVSHLCDLIIERKYDLNMWAYARVDTIDEGMLAKMKQAGINWLGYGIESASTMVRWGVDKKFHQAQIFKAIEMTHNAGIHINGNFIFGLPDDGLETMRETLNMAKELNLEYVNFYVAIPYPGSQLYDKAPKESLPKSWRGYSQYSKDTLPLPTKYLTSKEIVEFRDKAFIEYFTNPEYLRMLGQKFGMQAVEEIKAMLKQKIR